MKEIKKIDEKYTVIICGSFRRGAASSGDIDILVTHPTYMSSAHETESKDSSAKSSRNSENDKASSKKSAKNNSKPLLEKIVNQLTEIKFITDTLVCGDTKFMVSIDWSIN